MEKPQTYEVADAKHNIPVYFGLTEEEAKRICDRADPPGSLYYSPEQKRD